MKPLKSLDGNLYNFKKTTIELSNIGEQVSNENQVVMFVNSIPKTYDSMKVSIEYGMESLN